VEKRGIKPVQLHIGRYVLVQLDVLHNGGEALMWSLLLSMKVTCGKAQGTALQAHSRQPFHQAHIQQVHAQPEHLVFDLADSRTECRLPLLLLARLFPTQRLFSVVLAQLVWPRVLHDVLLVLQQVEQRLQADHGVVELRHRDLAYEQGWQ
jgi:hypothetical protein